MEGCWLQILRLQESLSKYEHTQDGNTPQVTGNTQLGCTRSFQLQVLLPSSGRHVFFSNNFCQSLHRLLRMVFMIAQVFLLFATVFLHWFLTTFSNCHLHTANQVTGPGGLSALVGCPRTRITSYCSRGFEQINPCFILPEICNWCLGMRCLKLWIVWWVCQSLISLDFWWASNP